MLQITYIVFIGIPMLLIPIKPLTDTTPPDGAGCPKGDVTREGGIHIILQIRLKIYIVYWNSYAVSKNYARMR